MRNIFTFAAITLALCIIIVPRYGESIKKGHFLINHIYQDAVPFCTVVRLRHMYRIVLYQLRRNSELMSENTLLTEIFDNNDNYPLEGKRE